MNQALFPKGLRFFLSFLFVCLLQLAVVAQEGGSTNESSTTTTTSKTEVQIADSGENWYSSPWVWAVGAGVFILLLVALTRGSRRETGTTDRVTVTKTVRRDSDTDTEV
jgi:hypothetical protein